MNRQVPESKKIEPIAIIGNGRAASHMKHYFASVGQSYLQWYRSSESNAKKSRLSRYKDKIQNLFKSSTTLESVVSKTQVVLLLLPDDQIEPFITRNPALKSKTVVHFSGSLHTNQAIGCHPLMTFGAQFYAEEIYKNIPFVVDEGVEFKALFPLLENPVHNIKTEDKALYHAYCVMAGNFSQMLWKNIQEGLEQINLPADIMSAYLLQNTKNFTKDSECSMTGPMIRGDESTIAKHQKVLSGHPLQDVYESFYQLNNQTKQLAKRNQI